jgi:hypothetical protein
MRSDKVLHLGRRCVCKAVAADEVVGEVVLLCVRCLAIRQRYCALAIGTGSCVRHVGGGDVKGCCSEQERAVDVRREGRSLSCKSPRHRPGSLCDQEDANRGQFSNVAQRQPT